MPRKKSTITAYMSLTPDMTKRFRSKLRAHKVRMISAPITMNTIEPDTEILTVFVDSRVSKEVIAAMPKLKYIVTLSTGFDHIDLAAAKKRGIPVSNVPSYGESTVAEYALALMLSLTRHILPAAQSVKQSNFAVSGFRGLDMEGKTIGIIGTGKIGRHLIGLLSGFGVRILAYDPYPNTDLTASGVCTYTTLAKLLKESDIISLHAPLTKDTEYLIDKKTIQKMKPGVILINTARGGLIRSADLLWGLEKDIIAGAGLDVLESENLLEDPCLFASHERTHEETTVTLMNNLIIDHPRTIVTPHNAFNTTEAVGRIIDTSTDNIKQFLAGTLMNDVT